VRGTQRRFQTQAPRRLLHPIRTAKRLASADGASDRFELRLRLRFIDQLPPITRTRQGPSSHARRLLRTCFENQFSDLASRRDISPIMVM
jgi:hypothetical protein